jgi:hypothetical protein
MQLTIQDRPKQPPNCSPEWPTFYRFVTTNLGDVPVLDDGQFISKKIQGYWVVWCITHYLIRCKTELTYRYFYLLEEYYLPKIEYPPTFIEHIRLQRFLNLWKLLGGATQ